MFPSSPRHDALSALTRGPFRFLTSAWPWRSLAYLSMSGVSGGAVLAIPLLLIFKLRAPDLVVISVAAVLTVIFVRLVGLPFELWRLRLLDPELAAQVPIRRRLAPRQLGYVVTSMMALWWIDVGVLVFSLGAPLLLLSAPLQPDASTWLGIWLAAMGGMLLFVAAYPMTAWMGARAALARALLFPQDRALGEIIRSRARLVDAFEAERRRIERDLHDGAQQRLVMLTIKLGLAQLDAPPGSPLATELHDAHALAVDALAELRELIRGIHPKVLTDRGLAAAIQDVAGHSEVPVKVDLQVTERLPATIESAAFYAVSEALTNVARHSGATRCSVRGEVRDDLLLVEVVDDGVGGADIGRGSGLQGLADRLAVVEGTLVVSSPVGGPTTLRVGIPCGTGNSE
ncbi:sensor histidine kinase [Actinokineospora cianjurensis]|uniref:histidine kinase n=1 Tax=Actinokineospora cianjurensis TaxID=585224 RepID=A0A421B9Z7_9PSEU|nr:histidine kinase [Actinokineospora cianjurensis]RLK61366.1 signal transduction histidine kinase [Actinokineospora cianjurensis]